jgi:hypothetical protein
MPEQPLAERVDRLEAAVLKMAELLAQSNMQSGDALRPLLSGIRARAAANEN